MLRRRPGVFVAGEMLDWEAPTGGYLLQACFATGAAAAAQWLQVANRTGHGARSAYDWHASMPLPFRGRSEIASPEPGYCKR